ncbi:MAG: CcmD family protein [Acidobacteriota bacterium]
MSYLFAAYTLIWLALFAYLVSLSRKQKKLDHEIAMLKKLLEEKK